MIEYTPDGKPKGFLLAAAFRRDSRRSTEYHLQELVSLAETAGIEAAETRIVSLSTIRPNLFLGKGQAEEIAGEVRSKGIEVIIFDEDLSPSQQRNWERLTGIRVIDRRELILDIFAAHAKTKEAMLQIELARYEYMLPRLTRAWTHLSRQQGGERGTRGEGEKQIELDRRSILSRIHAVKREIRQVETQRTLRRKNRIEGRIPSASIIGYTNAGKSSLLNYLTSAGVLTENKLFATLDPTTRKFVLPDKNELLLTDTVGFIRKLPHDLVEAFHSTLEESVYSDFLIHVVDAAAPEVEDHIAATERVLFSLGIEEKPRFTVFNKIDLIPDEISRTLLSNRYPEGMCISLNTGEGMDTFIERLSEFARPAQTVQTFTLPSDRHDLVAFLHRNGEVMYKDYGDTGISVSAKVSRKIRNKLEEYAV